MKPGAHAAAGGCGASANPVHLLGDRDSVTLLAGLSPGWGCGGIRNRAGSFVSRLLSFWCGGEGGDFRLDLN